MRNFFYLIITGTLIFFYNYQVSGKNITKKSNNNIKTNINISQNKLNNDYLTKSVTLIDAWATNNKVIVTWQDADGNFTYNIYRATNILNSPQKLDTAILAGNVKSGVQKFIDDKITKSGNYYYGVAIVYNGKINKHLIEDSSCTTIPVKIKIPVKKISPITNIKKTNIEITPKTNKPIVKKIKPIPIIKKETNTHPIVTNKPSAPSFKIPEIAPPIQLNEKPIKPINPIITIKTEENKKISNKNIISQTNISYKKEKKSTSKSKVKKKKIVKRKKIVDFNIIFIKGVNNFYNKNYYIAEKRFRYIINKTKNIKLRNKAMLFLGKVYFYEQKYKKALSIFAKVSDIYPDETNFWIERTLKKIGE